LGAFAGLPGSVEGVEGRGAALLERGVPALAVGFGRGEEEEGFVGEFDFAEGWRLRW